MRPEFGGDEDLGARDAGFFDCLADFAVYAVHLKREMSDRR